MAPISKRPNSKSKNESSRFVGSTKKIRTNKKDFDSDSTLSDFDREVTGSNLSRMTLKTIQ